MIRNAEKAGDVLAAVQRLLDSGQAKQAIELIRSFKNGSPALRNAYAVALLRAGEVNKAIEVYRNLLINESGVCLNAGMPALFKTNYATALLLARNVAGCLSVLREVEAEQDPQVVRLRLAIARWRKSLTVWQRFWFAVSSEAPQVPVQLDGPPGALSAPHDLRPAA